MESFHSATIEEIKEKAKQELLSIARFKSVSRIGKNASIHTYIIGHDNATVRLINLVSHTTYAVCVNFIH